MKVQNLEVEDVFHALLTSQVGLTDEEVQRRLREYGYNEIKEARKKPLSRRFLAQFTHFLALLLWIAAAMSFLSEFLHPGEGMLTLGIAIVAVIFINAVFTFVQEYRAEKALAALKKLLPFSVRVFRNGREAEIPARDIVPGDIMLLTEGDKIPADARFIETHELKVNHAPLTGESEPLLRDHAAFHGESIESPNIAFAGTTVVSGSGKAVVFATGMSTEFGRIAHLTSAVESGLSPLQKEIVKATRLVAAIAAAVGIFFFSIGFLIGRNFWDNFIFAIGITVALIPEGLLPTMTLSLAMGSQRMAKRKALIKNLPSVETLGAVSVICTDKTGTLTQNKMAVAKIWVNDELIDAGHIQKDDAVELFRTAYLCNNTRMVDGHYKGDPTEVALFQFARDKAGDFLSERLQELPFDAERKKMTTLNREDGKTAAFSKGAAEIILPSCDQVLARGKKMPLTEDIGNKIRDASHAMMDKGLRVLAFCYRDIERNEAGKLTAGQAEKNMVFAGLIGMEDPPRPEVAEAIRKCDDAGIKIIMMTGDAERTAVAIARETGLVKGNPVVIEGSEMDALRDQGLRERLSAKEVIFARVSPKHKMRVVSILKEEGEIVAVTGDGVNDAPALKKADIGIAMGVSGTDVAKEASDMILLDDNFATIVNAIEEGRAVYENIKKFITYIFASNIPEAVPYLAYILFSIPLPLTVIQILAVDLGTDMLPSLALGAEKPTPGTMKQPPRKIQERLLNIPLITKAYLFLGPIEAVACMFGFFWVLHGGGWIWGTTLPQTDTLYLQATTACLTAIIITQTGNVFACRSSRESVFSIGFFSNKLIFAGILAELLLQIFIVYHPIGNTIFGTAPLPASAWLLLLPFSVVLLAAEETRKVLSKKFNPSW